MTTELTTYTVRANGLPMGNYSATDEQAALDAYAQHVGYLDFSDLLDRTPGSTREEIAVMQANATDDDG